jgi:hypothetical protein
MGQRWPLRNIIRATSRLPAQPAGYPPTGRRSCTNADLRVAIPSPGIRCPMSVNPFAGKLAGHYDTWNVGAISLPGPGCRSTSSGLSALGAPSIPLGALGDVRAVSASSLPWRTRQSANVSCTRSVCQGLIRCRGRDAGKERRGSPAADRGPIRCVKIGANDRADSLLDQPGTHSSQPAVIGDRGVPDSSAAHLGGRLGSVSEVSDRASVNWVSG